jgi:hypothetical protein
MPSVRYDSVKKRGLCRLSMGSRFRGNDGFDANTYG